MIINLFPARKPRPPNYAQQPENKKISGAVANKAPPAAKEKLLKKFLFGISSKRFNGRREETRKRVYSRRPV